MPTSRTRQPSATIADMTTDPEYEEWEEWEWEEEWWYDYGD